MKKVIAWWRGSCFNHNVMSDMKKETTYEVLTNDGDATLGFIIAYDDDHAQRVAERTFCEGVTVKEAN